MNETVKPSVTIVHSLPGRVRVRVSHALKEPERLRSDLLNHEGVTSVIYTPTSRSVLVRFGGGHVSKEEIVLRVAFILSLDHGLVPVRLLTQPEIPVMGESATYSGVLIGLGLLGKLFGKGSGLGKTLEWTAGAGTAAAVFEHGWREARIRGNIDPEVLILGYLLTSFMKGNFLNASIITWISTFARHLIEPTSQGAQIEPVLVEDESDQEPRYEMVVREDTDTPEAVQLFNSVGGLVKYALSPGKGPGDLLDELREVSRVHDEVLEGYGRGKHGIPMHFR